ncbi:hypothetical protein ACFSCW_09670 [Sphingomonas tabacisoli]|uniref:Uncharacterized protein n=1 Tax=Sphingomonas tabacisoli TaxID=2249466 RepID=A0ABW4I3L3_9SPHN
MATAFEPAPYNPVPDSKAFDRATALAEFRHNMKLISIGAVLMVIGALGYLWLFDALNAVTFVAVALGVFLSVLIGCGLFAAAFFSDKSGVDQQVADASRSALALTPPLAD